jgi:hypothetical protein
MRRELKWIEKPNFWGWGCSECAWVFDATGTPTGESIDKMMQNYKQQRDRDFAGHVCAEHPGAKKPKS